MKEVATQFAIAPLKGEKLFQSFCLDLARQEWADGDAELHGRQGQGQNGVDITGTDHARGRGRAGMQCKGSESNTPRSLSVADFDDEVRKAKTLKPKLGLFIVAFTGPRDRAITNRAAEIREQHKAEGLFEVYAWAWDEILDRAVNHPQLYDRLRGMILPEASVLSALTPSRPGGASRLDRMQTLMSELSAEMVSLATPVETDADKALNASIDVLREFIRDGNSDVAIPQLKKFIDNLPQDSSPRIFFRAYANLGAAYVGTSQYPEAAVVFRTAADYEGETADGLTYRGRAEQLTGDTAAAYALVKQAYALDPSNLLAAALMVETADDDVATADLDAQLGLLVKEGDIGWALSRRYLRDSLVTEALAAAETIEDDRPWIRPLAVADAILNRYADDLNARMGIPLPAEDLAQLKRATLEYETAWAALKGRRDKAIWIHVMANLNTAYRLLRRDEEADALAFEAYKDAPESVEVQNKAALAYVHNGKFDAAAEIGERMASQNPDAALFAAHMTAAAKSFDRAKHWAEVALGKVAGDDRVRAAEILIQSVEHLTSAEAALKTGLALERDLPIDAGFLAKLAELGRRTSDTSVVERIRRQLDAIDVLSLNPLARFELGDAYADDGQWSKAADAIEGLYALDRPSALLSRRLFALMQADRRTEARDLFEQLTPDVQSSSSLNRLGAAIYERCGQLDKAIGQLNLALKIAPADLRSRLDWVRLTLRSGLEHVVQKWARSADAAVTGGPDDIIEFCQVLVRFGRRKPEAMALAYQTLLANWGTSESLHTKYTTLFLMQGPRKEAWLDPKAVAVDTEVQLTDQNGGKAVYRIESGSPRAGRIAPNHPLSQALFGKQKGDTVNLPGGIGEAIDWTVTEIKHVYIALLHEVMAQHGTLFPGNHSFGLFNITLGAPDAFEPMFERVRKRARDVAEVLDLYMNAQVPVDFIAQALGSNAAETAAALRWQQGVTLDTCHGMEAERAQALQYLSPDAPILVDSLTLSFWDEIGLVEHLNGKDLPIYAVQATLDDFTVRLEAAEMGIRNKSGVMHAAGDQIQLVEIPKTARREAADAAKRTVMRIRDRVTIMPTEPWPEGAFPAELDDALSSSTSDTLATAFAGTATLICDDRRLRALAGEVGLTRLAWTQPFLISLRIRGIISRQEYVGFLVKLAEHRLGFVSVDTFDLASTIHANDRQAFRVLCHALTGPNVEPSSLLNIVDVLLPALWLSAELKDVREFFTGVLFEQILTNRGDDKMLILQNAVTSVLDELKSHPFPAKLSTRYFALYVNKFEQGHFLRAGSSE